MSASSSSLITFLRFLGVEEEGLEMRLFLTAGDEETVYLYISNLLIFYWISFSEVLQSTEKKI